MTTFNVLSKQPINWPVLIEHYEKSTLNRKQFCQENNISLSQFKYHHAKLKRSSINAATLSLIPIHIKEASEIKPTQTNRHFQITFKNDIYCQIPVNVNAEKLKQLMEVLQAC
jgi:hypothetical protein